MNPLRLSCAILACAVYISVTAADKYSYFDMAVDKKYVGSIVDTLVVKTEMQCTMKCLASSTCMACNWDAATGSCEISTDHATITDAPGIAMYTRNCKTSELGYEYRGFLSTTLEGFTCQAWAEEGNPHSNLQPVDRFHDNVFPDNYCRNPDHTVGGPWCYTTDPSRRLDFCDVSSC